MAEVTSLAQLMKANARLKKHAEVAKKTVAQRDYTGPLGDVITTFQKVSIITKDGKIYVILDFKVDGSIPGQEDHNGARIGILHGLNDDDYGTIEVYQERLMMDIQRLGVKTADLSIDQIDAALKSLQGKQVTIRVVAGKKDKTKRYFNIVGVATGLEAPEFSSEIDEGEPEAEGEWDNELADPEAAEEEDALTPADYNPSDWIGFEVEYKASRSPIPLSYKVIGADDDKRTLELERDKKKFKDIPFDSVILPS